MCWRLRLRRDRGRRRLRASAAQPVSAVLLDLSLPEARDLTAIERVRKVAPGVAIMLLARRRRPGAGPAGRRIAAPPTTSSPTSLDTRSLCQLIAMMFERRGLDEQKFVERERAEITLNSIGDAVLTTDTLGNVTYLNAEAEGADRLDAVRSVRAAACRSLRRHRRPDRAVGRGPVAAGHRAPHARCA